MGHIVAGSEKASFKGRRDLEDNEMLDDEGLNLKLVLLGLVAVHLSMTWRCSSPSMGM